MNILESHKPLIAKLCESHKVQRLHAFGSVLTDNFNTKSDIDLIVEFKPFEILDYADNYFNLKFALQDLLKRPIDLLEETAIKNPVFKEELNKTRTLIYG